MSALQEQLAREIQKRGENSPAKKLGLGDAVPARKEQGNIEYQPSCCIAKHIAPDAMGD